MCVFVGIFKVYICGMQVHLGSLNTSMTKQSTHFIYVHAVLHKISSKAVPERVGRDTLAYPTTYQLYNKLHRSNAYTPSSLR